MMNNRLKAAGALALGDVLCACTAPKGPFFAVLRIYWPKPEALDGTWKQPPLVKVP
jgi:hypothetical protein